MYIIWIGGFVISVIFCSIVSFIQVAKNYLRDTGNVLRVNRKFPATDIQSEKKILAQDDDAILIYEFEFSLNKRPSVAEPRPARPFFVIDACNLNVLHFFDKVREIPSSP